MLLEIESFKKQAGRKIFSLNPASSCFSRGTEPFGQLPHRNPPFCLHPAASKSPPSGRKQNFKNFTSDRKPDIVRKTVPRK